MIIDVPSAAIEPFEPHGLPRRLHGNDTAVKLALKGVIGLINSVGNSTSQLVIEGMRYIIEQRLRKAGAVGVRVVIRGPFNDAEIPYCGYSVHYHIPGDKLRHHIGGPVFANGGFV